MYKFLIGLLLVVGSIQSSLVSARSEEVHLRLINNNVYVERGNTKIDQLTTRGNHGYGICDVEEDGKECIGYKIIKDTGDFGLVIKQTIRSGGDHSMQSIFLYSFKRGRSLINIDSKINSKFHLDAIPGFSAYISADRVIFSMENIDNEMGVGMDALKKYGFTLSDGCFFKQPSCNASIAIPFTYFKKLLRI